jgi:hypothetical protein
VKYAVSLIALLSLFLTGCASHSKSDEPSVHLGMTRPDLVYHFGEPINIETVPGGGETWYYHFATWSIDRHDGETASQDPDEASHALSTSWKFTKNPDLQGIHISTNGLVIEPLPTGRIIQK